jgi:hypothetical protein
MCLDSLLDLHFGRLSVNCEEEDYRLSFLCLDFLSSRSQWLLQRICKQSSCAAFGEVSRYCPCGVPDLVLTCIGIFGACPLAVVAAVFSDMFDNRTRGLAITVFSMTVFTGPLLAPFIGGFIVESYLGWRWTEW